MRPRLRHIPAATIDRFVEFARAQGGKIPAAGVLQKLVIFDFVAPVVESHPHGAILELGAGLGIHSALLSRYGAVSATELVTPGSFIGADRDVEMLRASALGTLADRPVSFAYNDGKQLPYADASFDIVFHNSVIEHVPDVVEFNREVHRVLRPGGICICITGTPALCRFRMVRDWLLMLPLHAAVAALRETPLLRELALGLLRIRGASDEIRCKVRQRLLRVDDRVRVLRGSSAQPEPDMPCGEADLTELHARLYHYLYFPEYNRFVLDAVARERGCSAERLLACLEKHFGKLGNRLRFAFTPRTHGQHYRNVYHEMAEWRIERWQQQFSEAGFQIEDIRGYRYHQLLEFTPFLAWNAVFYAGAAPCIHAAMERRMFDPTCASEIILIARRNG